MSLSKNECRQNYLAALFFFVKVLSYFSININKCILLIYYHIDRNRVYGQYFYHPFKLYKDDHLCIIEEELKCQRRFVLTFMT